MYDACDKAEKYLTEVELENLLDERLHDSSIREIIEDVYEDFISINISKHNELYLKKVLYVFGVHDFLSFESLFNLYFKNIYRNRLKLRVITISSEYYIKEILDSELSMLSKKVTNDFKMTVKSLAKFYTDVLTKVMWSY